MLKNETIYSVGRVDIHVGECSVVAKVNGIDILSFIDGMWMCGQHADLDHITLASVALSKWREQRGGENP